MSPSYFVESAGDIPYHRFLDEDGAPVAEPPDHAADPQALTAAYRVMVLVRRFDQKAIALQRTGQLGTYPASLGQEAIGAAIGQCLRAEDVFAPYYRDTATQIQRGASLVNLLQLWGGDERGNAAGGNDFPPAVPVATQVLHAAGAAVAMQLREERRVTLTTCGDGATSKGDFLEALNLAAVWRLPLVFVINNNQWAISVPRARQAATRTLAAKALGAGVPACQVDGNDAVALRAVLAAALDDARGGAGPRLVEAVTYRLCDHTTADDASRYRDEASLHAAWQREPIKRLRGFLHARGHWSAEDEQALAGECGDEVDAAVEAYLNLPTEDPSALFDHLYAHPPAELERQREALVAKAARQSAAQGGREP